MRELIRRTNGVSYDVPDWVPGFLELETPMTPEQLGAQEDLNAIALPVEMSKLSETDEVAIRQMHAFLALGIAPPKPPLAINRSDGFVMCHVCQAKHSPCEGVEASKFIHAHRDCGGYDK